MTQKKMIVVGEKESFLTRVLVKKVQDVGFVCNFVKWEINDINSSLEDVELITLFMDEGDKPSNEALHFLTDTMQEKNLQMIVSPKN